MRSIPLRPHDGQTSGARLHPQQRRSKARGTETHPQERVHHGGNVQVGGLRNWSIWKVGVGWTRL